MCIPLQTPVFYIKVGFTWVFIARTYFPDAVFLTGLSNGDRIPTAAFSDQTNQV